MKEASRPSNASPYVGPRAFTTGETLYGRGREVMELLDLLIAERIVLLHSPSGAGKTSLIQAALIPRLEEEGFGVLPTTRVSLEPPLPLAQQVGAPNRYVLSVLLSLEESVPVDQRQPWADLARMDLPTYLAQRASAADRADGQAIILDQFEEILTLQPTDRAAKMEFFVQVGAALRDRRTWALFSMREDFVASLEPYLRHVPTRLNTTYRLDLLGEEAARAAMQQPARAAGVEFMDAAVSKLIDDLRRVRVQHPDGSIGEQLGPYVEPVQLQVVCVELWDRLPADATRIEVADVDDVGDVDSALAGYYAQRIQMVASQADTSERAIRTWFHEHLVTPQGFRSQVLQEPERSASLPNQAIWPLVDAHLVRAEKRRGATWFELAHDRLIEPIRSDNRVWFEANLSLLQRQADIWDKRGRSSGLLLRDAALDEATLWASAHADALTAVERDFLDACRELRALEEERRQRAIELELLHQLAETERQKAEHQGRLSFSRELAAAAHNNLDADPERSILLALHAVNATRSVDGVVTAEAEDALHAAVQASRVRTRLVGHDDRVTRAIYSPDGARIGTASADRTARVWDARSGALLCVLSGHIDSATDLAFSPDGALLATASADGSARLWDLASSRELRVLHGHSGQVLGVAFSPAGTRVATAGEDKTVRLWDAASGRPLQVLSGHTKQVNAVVFSLDGLCVASASADATGRVWETVSGRPLLTLDGHNDWVTGVAFSPDGTRVVTASYDRFLKIWQVESGELLLAVSTHTDWLTGIAFSPDGRWLATSSYDRTARVFDAASGREVLILRGHTDWVHGLDFSPDGSRLLTASADKTARTWNVMPDEQELTLYSHFDRVYTSRFDPSGSRITTASDDGTAKIWDATSGQEVSTLRGHASGVSRVAFSPDGIRLATSGYDNLAKVWDATAGIALGTLQGHSNWVIDVAFSPDGTRLVTASSDGTAVVWDITSEQPIFTLSGHEDWVSTAAFSPDGTKLATGSDDKTAIIWEAESGKRLLTLSGHRDWIDYLDFSPDGRWLATVGHDKIGIVWDVATGEPLVRLVGHTHWIRSVSFAPDGTRLATGSTDRTARIWDAASGQELLSLIGHADDVFGVSFSPDGRRLATASWDRTARVWDAVSGEELLLLSNQAGQLNAVAYSPDGRSRLYRVHLDDLLPLARARVTRSLTPEECLKYLHVERCPPTP